MVVEPSENQTMNQIEHFPQYWAEEEQGNKEYMKAAPTMTCIISNKYMGTSNNAYPGRPPLQPT